MSGEGGLRAAAVRLSDAIADRSAAGRSHLDVGSDEDMAFLDAVKGLRAALAVEAVRPEMDIDEELREAKATIEAMSGDAADLTDLIHEAALLRTALAHVIVRTHDSGCGTCDAARALLTAEHELPSSYRDERP